MRLTRGEWFGVLLFLPVVIGFLPPITGWAAGIETRVLGLPFLLFWNGLMVTMTTVMISLALVVKDRVDRS